MQSCCYDAISARGHHTSQLSLLPAMLRALVTLLVCLLPLVSAFALPQPGALAACRSAAPAISSAPARRRPAQLSKKRAAPRLRAWLSKRPGSGCALRWWLPARLVLIWTLGCARLPTVAHHVQKKATKGHNAYRPKKKRPSDIFRKPPSYPPIPDIPWYTKIDGLTQPASSSSSSAPASS